MNHYWLSPTGTNTWPGVEGNPAAFDADELWFDFAWESSQQSAPLEFHYHLAAGTYEDAWFALEPDPEKAKDTKVFISGPSGQSPDDTVLRFPSDKNWARNPHGTNVVAVFSVSSSEPYGPIAHFQMENLTLDGNWSNQLANTSPSYEGEARMNGLTVVSYTGLIRNVIVRNVGVHGRVPHSRYSSPSFTEGFVFNVVAPDIGQAAPAGQNLPWVIEDCELNDFG